MNDPRNQTQYRIVLLDHSDDVEANHPELFGNDYIAGGAGEDEIFGQLGNDVIQGDGTIGVQAGADFAKNLVAAQLSLTRSDGSIVSINDFTQFGANRGAVPTSMTDFGFNMDPSLDLLVNATFEGLYDGDDYIEGNGGNDVIFGGLGQDDVQRDVVGLRKDRGQSRGLQADADGIVLKGLNINNLAIIGANATNTLNNVVVMRNRMSPLAARNKERVGGALENLSKRIGFRLAPGLSERVIYRELFPAGLTLLDLTEAGSNVAFTMSHKAARQELRDLVIVLQLPELAGASIDF